MTQKVSAEKKEIFSLFRKNITELEKLKKFQEKELRRVQKQLLDFNNWFTQIKEKLEEK